MIGQVSAMHVAINKFVYVTSGQGCQPSIIGSKRADGRPALQSFRLTAMLCVILQRLGLTVAVVPMTG